MLVLLSVLVPGRSIFVNGFLVILHNFLRGFFLILAVVVLQIRDLEKQKQEEENSQIVQAVRSLKLTPAELMAFLNDPKNAFSASGQSGPKSEDTGKEENAHEEN